MNVIQDMFPCVADNYEVMQINIKSKVFILTKYHSINKKIDSSVRS